MDGGRLAGKTVVVTGAGAGVGRAVAVAVAREGAVPALVARTPAALAETAELVAAIGGRALVVPADVTDEVAVAMATQRVVAELGGIDALVLAAGIGRFGPVATYPMADWEATLATNLTGPFLCVRAAAPHLLARGGAVVAISSGAGKQGYANLAAYSASKFGLHGLLESVAAELGPQGVKVTVVVPGSILTGFGGRDAETKRAAAASDPGKRYLEPEDVAEIVREVLLRPARAWTAEVNVWPF